MHDLELPVEDVVEDRLMERDAAAAVGGGDDDDVAAAVHGIDEEIELEQEPVET